MQQQMISSEKDLSHEEKTPSLPDDEVSKVYQELEKLVRGNDLENALGEEIKPKILHLCKILDGSKLPESRLRYVKRGEHLLESTSFLFSVWKYCFVDVKLYELAKDIVEKQHKRGKDADVSITPPITLFEKWFAAELQPKVISEDMINYANRELQWKMEEWKYLL